MLLIGTYTFAFMVSESESPISVGYRKLVMGVRWTKRITQMNTILSMTNLTYNNLNLKALDFRTDMI